jgi:hypothetical protein
MFRSLPVGVKRPLLLLVLLTISSTRLSMEVITKPLTKPGDFDGDSKSDVTVYRFGHWLVLQSSTDFHNSVTYGLGVDGDIPEPGDYDGDGKTDPAVFDWATGVHSILLSSTNFVTHDAHQWGISTDIPEPGDYDGDGKTDVAVYRPSDGYHYILLSSTNFTTYGAHRWGIGSDIPEPGDYDGAGRLISPSTDPATALITSCSRAPTSPHTALISGGSAPTSRSRAITTETGRPISPSFGAAAPLTTSCYRAPTSRRTAPINGGSVSTHPYLDPHFDRLRDRHRFLAPWLTRVSCVSQMRWSRSCAGRLKVNG